MTAVDWTRDVLPWAPPGLTILGWYLVNLQNNKREVRKEMRSACDRSKALVRESVVLGFQYWAGVGGVQAWQIKAALEELEIELCRFPDQCGRQDLLNKHADLLDAIMGEDFESQSRSVRTSTDSLIREAAKARQRLLVEIEVQFVTHYC